MPYIEWGGENMTPFEWQREHFSEFLDLQMSIDRLQLRFANLKALVPFRGWSIIERQYEDLFDDVERLVKAIEEMPGLPEGRDPCPTNSKPGSTTGAGSNST